MLVFHWSRNLSPDRLHAVKRPCDEKESKSEKRRWDTLFWRAPMRRLCYAVTVLLCFSNFLFAQVNTASLTGLITDSTGATVAHVRVTAQSAGTGYTRTVETDPSGYYFFQELPI